MKTKITTKLIIRSLALGAGCLILWSWYQGRGPEYSAESKPKVSQVNPSTQDFSVLDEPQKTIKPRVRHVVVQPAGAVKVPKLKAEAPDAVKNFRNWAQSYFDAQPAARAALVQKGQELATLQRAEIKKTITTDPQMALELAVPMVVRQDLPDEIEKLLERRVNEVGDFMVLGALPDKNVPSSEQSAAVLRKFKSASTAPGQLMNAHVYGDRARLRTRSSMRVSGIEVDRELAILDASVRPLEVGERPDPDKPIVNVCPISGKSTPVEKTPEEIPAPVTAAVAVVEDNRKTYFLCASGHIQAFGEKLFQEESDAQWAGVRLAEGGTGGGTKPFDVPVGFTTGTKSLLYLRVAFPDKMVDPQSEASVYESLRQTTEFFMNNSFGRFYITPTVTPLIVLPHPEAFYNSYRDGYDMVRDQALSAAARMGYDWTTYDLDVVEYKDGPGGFGGLGFVGARGVWLRFPDPYILAHELGHNLGLWHSNYWDTNPPSVTGPGFNIEYGNKFDVMGQSGSRMGDIVAVHKAMLGWLPPESVHRVADSGKFRIYQADQDRADADKRYALSVNMDSERDYWFEFRQKETTNVSLSNGLMVTWSPWGTGNAASGLHAFGSNRGAQLLDMTPGSRPWIYGTPGVPQNVDSRDDAALVLGQTYSDHAVDVHVTPVFKSGTVPPYIDVVVNRGPFPVNTAPQLSLSASSRTVNLDDSILFTAAGVDPESDELAYSWHFGDGSYSTDNKRTQRKSWLRAGQYSVVCIVSDMKGKTATKSILVTVTNPLAATFDDDVFISVSGTVRDIEGNPVEGVYMATEALRRGASQDGNEYYRYTYTDSQGKYTLTNIRAATETTSAAQVTLSATKYPNTFVCSIDPVFTPDISDGDLTSVNWTDRAVTPAYEVKVQVNASEVDEGDDVTITLTRTNNRGILSLPILVGTQGSATRGAIAGGADYLLETPSWTVSPFTAPVTLPAAVPATGPDADQLRGALGVTFRDFQYSVVITVKAHPDSLAEGTEYAVIDFPDAAFEQTTTNDGRNYPYFVTGQRTAVIAIKDDDSALPVVTLIRDAPNVSENGAAGILRIRRDGPVTLPLSVDLTYSGQAIRGTDYTAPATVIIPPGFTEVPFTLQPIDDLLAEGTETFKVSLAASPSYLRHTRAYRDKSIFEADMFLSDNDQPVVQVSATVPTISEGSSTAGRFVIRRAAVDIGNDLIVNFSLGGSALSGSDYRRVDGVAIIPANELSVDVDIKSIQDSIDEPNQTVVLRISADPEYAIGASNEATVTITDNDASQFTIQTIASQLPELAQGKRAYTPFRVTRPAPGQAATVRFSVSGTAIENNPGTPNDTDDYAFITTPPTPLPPIEKIRTVDFLPEETSKDIRLEVYADTDKYEGAESIIVNLVSGSGYGLGFETQATTFIEDIDTVEFDVAFDDVLVYGNTNPQDDFGHVKESTAPINVRFLVSRNAAGSAVTVKYRFGGTAALGQDFQYFTAPTQPFELDLIDGQRSSYIVLRILNDALLEGTETLTLELLDDDAYAVRSRTSTIFIDDDESYAGQTVGFTSGTGAVLEKTSIGNGNFARSTYTAVVNLNPAQNGEVTVFYRIAGGTATGNGVDYQLNIPSGDRPDSELLLKNTGFLRFAAQEQNKTITFTTENDDVPEGDETVVLELFGAVGANLGTTRQTVTIQDHALPDVFTDVIPAAAGPSATLRGRVIANNLAATPYFEWGTSTSRLTATPNLGDVGGTTMTPISQVIPGLVYPSTYYYRAVASNQQGRTFGIMRTLRTIKAPDVITTSDAGHTASSIVLAGSINPNRGIVDYHFEWGTAINALNASTPVRALPNGTRPVVVTGPLTGLSEGQAIFYELVAISRAGLGTVRGGVQIAYAVPFFTAGNLVVNAAANHSSAGTSSWANLGVAGGNFVEIDTTSVIPNVHDTGAPGVFFNGKNIAYELTIPGATAPWTEIIGADSRSVEIWAYNPGYGTADTLFNMGKDGVGTQLAVNHSNLTQTQTPTALKHGNVATLNSSYTAKNLPALKRWNHFAYVYDGPKKTATLYINGVRNTTVKRLTLATSLEPITIGALRDAAGTGLSDYMQGYINSVRIHGGVLTPANVLTNFQVGPTRSTATPPVVASTGVSGLTTTSATLNGNAATTATPATTWFEWGTSTAYDNASPPVPVVVSPNASAFSLSLPNLVPGVEYHYRFASRNPHGTSYGEDVSFTPQVLPSAGRLWVDLRAQDYTGAGAWTNRGALGEFAATGTTAVSTNVAGTGYPGVQFDGSTTAFESVANASIDFSYGDDQTLEVWAFNHAIGADETLVNQGRAITPASRLRLSYSSALGVDDNSTPPQVQDGWTTAPAAGRWTHFAVVVSGTSRSLYIDGSLSGTTTQPAGVNQWEDRILLGALRKDDGGIDFTTGLFSGFINTVRVHGGAMLPAQIKASFDAGPSTDKVNSGLAPIVTTTSATVISDLHATLPGTIAAGGLPTTYWFEWGTNPAILDKKTPVTELANTFSSASVTAPIGGLAPSQAIHYRLVAKNALSTLGRTEGAILTFNSLASALAGLPKAQTNPETARSLGRATLNGLATAGTSAAMAWFEYGPTIENELKLKSPKVAIAANAAPRAMTFVASALLPHTSYSYRLVVENANGLVVGAIRDFISFNSVPVASAISLRVTENVPTAVPVRGTDADREPITFNIVPPGPTKGTITAAGNSLFYTSTGNLSGADTFQYTVTDGVATSSPATVAVTITPANDAPIAQAATHNGNVGAAITANLVGTDEENDPITAYLISKQPKSGSLFVTAGSLFTYTPDVGSFESDSFEFRVVAGGQTSAPAIVTLNQTATAPTALETNLFTAKNQDLDGQVLALGPLSATGGYNKASDPLPAQGLVTDFDPDSGEFTFEPANDFIGNATFTFTVTDGMAVSAPATVTIVVGGPVAYSMELSGYEDDVVAGTLQADNPNNSGAMTYSLVAGASVKNGKVSVGTNGTFTYNPKAGFVGVDRFKYQVDQVTSGGFVSEPATVTITVTKRPPNWVWVQGRNVARSSGAYGELGTAAATNLPGARGDSASWTQADGTLWIFGGQGFAEGKVAGALNDLWKRDPDTGVWTWVSGSSGINANGIYGAQGITAPTSHPGARSGAATWLDQDGIFWMFGGNGFDAASTKPGILNDLWSYDPGSEEWTWWKGSSVANVNGTYGVRSVAASTNTPGSRQGAATWLDAENNLWLFGGQGLPGVGPVAGQLGDLWKYSITENIWTWVSGASVINTNGVYGVLGGNSNVTLPGARSFAATWMDENGIMYLFGGNGLGAAGRSIGFLNDIWVYYPESNRWSWIKGSQAVGAASVSRLLGLSDPLNVPSGRAGAGAWVNGKQEAWLFGGQARSGHVNDLWRFDFVTREWTMLKGPSPAAVYGNLGTGLSNNTPGGRRGYQYYMAQSDLYLFGGANGANNFNDLWKLDFVDTPQIQALAATDITATEAQLNARIQFSEEGALVGFRYWPLGDISAVVEDTTNYLIPNGPQFIPVELELTGLSSGTRYAFQAITKRDDVTIYGSTLVFETDGAADPITVEFPLTSRTVSEKDLAYAIEVRLSAPADELVIVPITAVLPGPLTISGVAEPITDYPPLSNVISFAPGQTSFFYTVPLVNNNFSEPDELLDFTLGTPVGGGVSLGTNIAFNTIIKDDDGAPNIVTHPTSAFVPVGQPMTLTTVATGDRLKYQWKVDDKVIPRATSSSYQFVASLSTAAIYTCVVSNELNEIETDGAEIFVLDSKTQSRLAPSGSEVILSVTAAAPKGLRLTHKWRDKNDTDPNRVIATGGRIRGSRTNAMTITGVLPTDSKVYVCRVEKTGAPDFFAISQDQILAVPDVAPVVEPVAGSITGVVGVPFSHQVVVNTGAPNDIPSVLRRAPFTFTAENLPRGLSINAVTGLISGRPTTSGNSTVRIIASNPSGVSAPRSITIQIIGLPPAVPGTYVALLDRAPATANMGGRVDLSILSTGAYTVKLTLSGFTASAKGSVLPTIVSPLIPDVKGTALFRRKVGQSNLSLDFMVTDLGVMTAVLTDLQTPPITASAAGVRQGYSTTNPVPNPVPTPQVGDYTMLFEPKNDLGVISVPQGNGFVTMAVATDGKISGAGRTADGSSFTLATILGADGKMPIFAAFTPVAGTLQGTPEIGVTGYLSGDVTWNKSAAPLPVRSLLYHQGFPTITMQVMGGRYRPIDIGAVVLGLTGGANNARLVFSEGGLLTTELDRLIVSITNPNPARNTQVIGLPSPNPNKLSLAIPAKPAGSFNGKVTILNPTPALVRNLVFQGVMAKINPTTWKAAGFVLVPQLPQPSQTIGNSPILSGQVLLEAHP